MGAQSDVRSILGRQQGGRLGQLPVDGRAVSAVRPFHSRNRPPPPPPRG